MRKPAPRQLPGSSLSIHNRFLCWRTAAALRVLLDLPPPFPFSVVRGGLRTILVEQLRDEVGGHLAMRERARPHCS